MECITHFSHQHPLNPFQLDDFEDVKPYKCAICGLPILHTPSYTCTANCKFFLHKPCTQLPQEFYHVSHSDTLHLMLSESHENFNYRCIKYDSCEFEVHPLVAKPAEIKSKHTSHASHPLVAFCREIVSLCDGCGEVQTGFFFHCQECNFWIHQDCTVLPTIVKLIDHPHPFILVYALPINIIQVGHRCSICSKPWRLCHTGVYLDERFRLAHVTCAKSKMESIQSEIVQLPDDEDAFPSLVIRKSLETQESRQNMHHEHPLMLEDGSSRSSRSARDDRPACGDDLVCDVCTQPIYNRSSPIFYRCQSDGCHFIAHKMCADNLPTNIQLSYAAGLRKGALSNASNFFFNSTILCVFCFLPSNGFSYTLFNDQGEIAGVCDVECSVAPKAIKHASHRQHLLFQMPSDMRLSIQPRCCSRESFPFDVYTCVACDFHIHIRCALLPKNTRHKFDRHPLELIMTTRRTTDGRQLFCELCEEEIELKFSYYGCHICEQYFHINCIPSVGVLRKVKFGKTYDDHRLHEHPLALTRMLTHGFHESCGICHRIIKGFAEGEMAFHCSPCHLWIHFSCASATAGLLDYSLFQLLLEQSLRNSIRFIRTESV